MPRYTVILEPEDDEIAGYAVSVPALPGCLSQGTTQEQALANIREAIALHIGMMRLDGEPFPDDVRPIVATVDVEPATPSKPSREVRAMLDVDGTPAPHR